MSEHVLPESNLVCHAFLWEPYSFRSSIIEWPVGARDSVYCIWGSYFNRMFVGGFGSVLSVDHRYL